MKWNSPRPDNMQPMFPRCPVQFCRWFDWKATPTSMSEADSICRYVHQNRRASRCLKNGEITLGTRHETTIRIQKDTKRLFWCRKSLPLFLDDLCTVAGSSAISCCPSLTTVWRTLDSIGKPVIDAARAPVWWSGCQMWHDITPLGAWNLHISMSWYITEFEHRETRGYRMSFWSVPGNWYRRSEMACCWYRLQRWEVFPPFFPTGWGSQIRND